MSNLLNKAKVKVAEALNKDKGDNVESSNYGPHSSNTANKVDPRIDSDMDHRNDPTSTYGNTTSGGAYTGTTTTAGGYDNQQSTNAGPHSSNLANKIDPRVDSDRDNRNDPTSRVGGFGQQEGYGGSGVNPLPGSGHPHSGVSHTGTHTTGAYDNPTAGGYNNPTTSGYNNPQSTTAGPHSSNFANKLDPRVDSDRDNRNDPTSRVGGYGTQDNYGISGANPAQTSGYGGQTTGYGNQPTGGLSGAAATSGGYDDPRSSNFGPHSSNLANKVDPRVDSDGDNRNNPTSRVGGYGAQDNYGTSGANPNVSSNYGGNTGGFASHNPQSVHHTTTTEGNFGSSATPGSGNASNTAGPHNSNLLNKLDPRVDSDMDGSKTYGGNQS